MRNTQTLDKRTSEKGSLYAHRDAFSKTSTEVLEKAPSISKLQDFNFIAKPSIFKGRKRKSFTVSKSSISNLKNNSGVNQKSIVTVVPSKIVEINPQFFFMECLIDKNNEIYELREYPIILFAKYKGLKEGSIFNLNIYQLPNNIHIEISDLNDSSLEALFDTSKLFDDLEGFENIHFQ